MEKIGEDENVIHYLVNDLSLISSRLKDIIITGSDGNVRISITFLLSRINADVVLVFHNVYEYSFYHNNKYDFYNVEYLKFFKKNERIYLSLDPADGSNISDDDNDFILSESIEGFILYHI
ncbi:hypothetical protein [Pedobacter nototheniae]|uniref:hypothetical protein n=1 Tax=Pedobacter nototheniae TaxID=2488994 RepID=UPI0010391E9D|nr:hypothetical protein [Pedobacter nototheniae]